MINEKDLMPVKLEELVPGYIFYRKEPDGSFVRCKIEPEELKDFGRRTDLLYWTKKYFKEGRLFRRINAPGKSFVK